MIHATVSKRLGFFDRTLLQECQLVVLRGGKEESGVRRQRHWADVEGVQTRQRCVGSRRGCVEFRGIDTEILVSLRTMEG
jgi:hypothetical protein